MPTWDAIIAEHSKHKAVSSHHHPDELDLSGGMLPTQCKLQLAATATECHVHVTDRPCLLLAAAVKAMRAH